MTLACLLVCSMRASSWHFISLCPSLDGVKIKSASQSHGYMDSESGRAVVKLFFYLARFSTC